MERFRFRDRLDRRAALQANRALWQEQVNAEHLRTVDGMDGWHGRRFTCGPMPAQTGQLLEPHGINPAVRETNPMGMDFLDQDQERDYTRKTPNGVGFVDCLGRG